MARRGRGQALPPGIGGAHEGDRLPTVSALGHDQRRPPHAFAVLGDLLGVERGREPHQRERGGHLAARAEDGRGHHAHVVGA